MKMAMAMKKMKMKMKMDLYCNIYNFSCSFFAATCSKPSPPHTAFVLMFAFLQIVIFPLP